MNSKSDCGSRNVHLQQAEKSIKFYQNLRGNKENDEQVQLEMDKLRRAVNVKKAEEKEPLKLSDFKTKRARKALTIGMSMVFTIRVITTPEKNNLETSPTKLIIETTLENANGKNRRPSLLKIIFQNKPLQLKLSSVIKVVKILFTRATKTFHSNYDSLNMRMCEML